MNRSLHKKELTEPKRKRKEKLISSRFLKLMIFCFIQVCSSHQIFQGAYLQMELLSERHWTIPTVNLHRINFRGSLCSWGVLFYRSLLERPHMADLSDWWLEVDYRRNSG